jgi:urea transport system substrate-binding protein
MDYENATRKNFLKAAGAVSLGGALLAACGSSSSGSSSEAPATSAAADTAAASGGGSTETIKVGLLNALSGVLSITEKSIYDGSMLAIEQVNAAGGVNGRMLEPITEDYASDFTIAVQKAQKLLTEDKVAIVIGGYTSASRVAMIPTFQKNNALFFYGTYYEGLECDPNTFYGGATPNQFLVDYVPWILENLGKSMYIVGSDYLYPRTVSAIVQKLAKDNGGSIVGDQYFPLGTTDFGSVIADIGAKKPDVVFSNLVGDSTPAFYKQFRAAGYTPDKLPIAATVTTEVEVQAMGAENAAGNYMTSTYFQSLDNPANTAYVAAMKAKYGEDTVTHMPQVGTYDAVWLFANAAAKIDGDITTEALSAALVGATYDENPEGQPITVLANHHCNHPSYVGMTNADGQYDVVATFAPTDADPFPSVIVPENKRPTCPTPFKPQ